MGLNRPGPHPSPESPAAWLAGAMAPSRSLPLAPISVSNPTSYPLSNPVSAATSARSPAGSLLDEDSLVPGFRSCPSPSPSFSPGFVSCRSPSPSPSPSPRPRDTAPPGQHAVALSSLDSSAPASPSPDAIPAAALAGFGSLLHGELGGRGAARCGRPPAATCSLDAGARSSGLGFEASGGRLAASCSLDDPVSGLSHSGGCVAPRGAQGNGPSGQGLGLPTATLGSHGRTSSAPLMVGWDAGGWDAPPPPGLGGGNGDGGAAGGNFAVPPSAFCLYEGVREEHSGAGGAGSVRTEAASAARSGPSSNLSTLLSWGSFAAPDEARGGGSAQPSAGPAERAGASVSGLGSGSAPSGPPIPGFGGAGDGSGAAGAALGQPHVGLRRVSAHAICVPPGPLSGQAAVAAHARSRGAMGAVGDPGRGALGDRGRGTVRARGQGAFGMAESRGRLAAWEAQQLSSFAQQPS